MTIVQCAKAPDAKQLVNQVPIPYPLFPLRHKLPHQPTRVRLPGTRKINIERTMLLSQRTAKRMPD
jgi:hypothetical protein